MPAEKYLHIPCHTDIGPNANLLTEANWFGHAPDRPQLTQDVYVEPGTKRPAEKIEIKDRLADARLSSNLLSSNSSHTRNIEFIKKVNEENTVSPVMEWGIFGGALATKGAAKAYVLSKIGTEMGAVGKYAVPVGVTAGVVGAGFLTYEVAELVQNSGRASSFEKRLLAEPDARVRAGQQPEAFDLDGSRKSIVPGFRDVVNVGIAPIHSGFHYLLSGTQLPDENQALVNKAIAHNHLSNKEYVNWAKQESGITLTRQIGRDAIFGGMGLGGGVYAAMKLGLGRYGAIGLAALGIASGIGLSHLKTAADERTQRATLYQTRLSLF